VNDFITDPLVTLVLGVCLGVLLTIAAVRVAEILDQRSGSKREDD